MMKNRLVRILMLLLVAVVCSSAPVQTQAGKSSALSKSIRNVSRVTPSSGANRIKLRAFKVKPTKAKIDRIMRQFKVKSNKATHSARRHVDSHKSRAIQSAGRYSNSHKCKTCNGHGWVYYKGYGKTRFRCPKCGGTGRRR